MRNRCEVDSYSFNEYVLEIDGNEIIKARQTVAEYIRKGILKNNSFDDMVWILDDQKQTRQLIFPEVSAALEKNCQLVFQLSASMFIVCVKTYITMNFGISAALLQEIAKGLRVLTAFLSETTTLQAMKTRNAAVVVDFLSMIPRADGTFVDDALEELEYYDKCYEEIGSGSQRALAQYRSYYRFEELIKRFWNTATEAEKILFFPIWFWWKVSTLIPLRPTEVVLTPRACITSDGKLVIRRTKGKKKNRSSHYNIELDFIKNTYSVPSEIINTVIWYREATENGYLSDVNTLFSLDSARIDMSKRLSSHFTYHDMNRLLSLFFEQIVKNKFDYSVPETSHDTFTALCDDEIERIRLGDTRHIAMLNIFMATKNPELCRELAGHEDINISAHYFSNIQSFVKAISFESYRKQSLVVNPQGQSMLLNPMTKISMPSGGFCTSAKRIGRKGAEQFDDCKAAVDKDGGLFECTCCEHYISPNPTIQHDAKVLSRKQTSEDDEFKKSFVFLTNTICSVQKGTGNEDDINNAFLKFQAATSHYKNTLIKKYSEEGYHG